MGLFSDSNFLNVATLGSYGVANEALGELTGANAVREGIEASSAMTERAYAGLTPYREFGLKYLTQLDDLMSGKFDVSKLPSYQFRLDQGLEGLGRKGAAAGYRGSGNMALEMQRYGSDYASSEWEKEYQRMFGLAQLGGNAAAGAGNIMAQGAGTSMQGYGALGTAQGSLLNTIGQGVGAYMGRA